MALATSNHWEVRSGGSDANGGAFNPNNANFATDGAVTSATGDSPVFSSASYNFVAGDVGAWLFIKSGTNSIPGWYKITSVASNQATLSGTEGTAVLYANTCAMAPTTAKGCGTNATLSSLTWGVDYSQQDSPKHSFTDLVIDGTTNTDFTSAANPVGKNFVGNHINIASGTGFTVQTVEVVSTTGTTGRADKSLGTLGSTGGTGKLGGGNLTLGWVGALATTSWQIWQQSGTYLMTSTTANISGGRFAPSAAGADGAQCRITGYETVRGDFGTKPINKPSGVGNFTMFTIPTNARALMQDLEIDGISTTTMTGVLGGTLHVSIDSCTIKNCTTRGVYAAALVSNCTITGCGVGLRQVINVTNSSISACTTAGLGANFIEGCLIYKNTGANTDGVSAAQAANGPMIIRGCTISGNGRDGVRHSAGYLGGFMNIVESCIIQGNGGAGITIGTSRGTQIKNCAFRSNTSGNVSGTPLANSSSVSLSGDPFTNSGSDDYSLDNTSGEGAACRAAGLPSLFPGGLTTGYRDIGAVQHQDSGGSGGKGSIIGC